jgi:hypothetical protein
LYKCFDHYDEQYLATASGIREHILGARLLVGAGLSLMALPRSSGKLTCQVTRMNTDGRGSSGVIRQLLQPVHGVLAGMNMASTSPVIAQ